MIRRFRLRVRDCILMPKWVRIRHCVIAEAEAIRVGIA